jgi:hypothetical protein
MALVGYEYEKERIEARIGEIQAALKGKKAAPGAENRPARVPRVLSAAARGRIAAAQRKRWAEHRKRAAAAQAASGD